MTENKKISEKEFLEHCLEKYKLKSNKTMQSLEDIKKIFKSIEKRINDLEVAKC